MMTLNSLKFQRIVVLLGIKVLEHLEMCHIWCVLGFVPEFSNGIVQDVSISMKLPSTPPIIERGCRPSYATIHVYEKSGGCI